MMSRLFSLVVVLVLVVAALGGSSPVLAQACTGQSCQNTCSPSGCLPVTCASADDGYCYCRVTSKVIGGDQVVNTCRSYFPCSLTCPGDGSGFPVAVVDTDPTALAVLLGKLPNEPILRAAVRAAYDENLDGFHPSTRSLVSRTVPGTQVDFELVRHELATRAPFLTQDSPAFAAMLEAQRAQIGNHSTPAELAIIHVTEGRGERFIDVQIFDHPPRHTDGIRVLHASDPAWEEAALRLTLVGTLGDRGEFGSFSLDRNAAGIDDLRW